MFRFVRARRAVLALIVLGSAAIPIGEAKAHNVDTTYRGTWQLQQDPYMTTVNGDAHASIYAAFSGNVESWTIQATRVADNAADGKCIELWVDFENVEFHTNPSMFRRCSTGSYGSHGKTDTISVLGGTSTTGAEVAICRVNYSGSLKTRSDCRSNRGTSWPQNVSAYQNRSDSDMSSQVYIHYLN